MLRSPDIRMVRIAGSSSRSDGGMEKMAGAEGSDSCTNVSLAFRALPSHC